ncbi:MAG: hypothetical protein Q4C95_13035 [Planctomycetia bacterium]|nr:hypothetical protein [Planctomycetia bacterium]
MNDQKIKEVLCIIDATKPPANCSAEFAKGFNAAKGVLLDKTAFVFGVMNDHHMEEQLMNNYRQNVLQSDIPQFAKEFFLKLLEANVLQTGYGVVIEDIASPKVTQAVDILENNGFLWSKRYPNGTVSAVFHRMGIGCQ